MNNELMYVISMCVLAWFGWGFHKKDQKEDA